MDFRNLKRNITIHSKIDNELNDFLEKKSKDTGLTKSYIVFYILKSFYEVHEDKQYMNGNFNKVY